MPLVLYHGSAAAEAIRRDGFRTGSDLGARFRCPWISTTPDCDIALAYAHRNPSNVVAIDAGPLHIMPANIAMDGPEDEMQYVSWVLSLGYDAFEHPQENDEICIVNLSAIHLHP